MSDGLHPLTPANDREPILPAFAVIAALVLIACSFGAAILGKRPGFHSVTPQASSPVVAVRHLHFVDQADGGIAIYEGDATVPFDVLAPGGDSFLRGTLRSLARARRLQHQGPEAPIDLVRHQDGQLSLQDPASGEVITLVAFGPTNAEVFERIMTKGVQKHE